jgi:hypothetical protein
MHAAILRGMEFVESGCAVRGRGVTVMVRESGVDSGWAVQGPDASWAARS